MWPALTPAERRWIIRLLHIQLWFFIRWEEIPKRFLKTNFYLVLLYLLLLRPPLRSPLEIPIILGASLSTFIITYTISDLLAYRRAA